MGDGGECKVDPSYASRRHEHHHALRRVLLLVTSVLIAILVLLALTTFIVWLVLRPIHSPSWDLDSLKVITLNIKSYSTKRRLLSTLPSPTPDPTAHWGITTYLLNADIALALRANNPNHHMEITYDRIEVKVAYATAVIGHAMLEPFTQAKRNCTVLGAEVKAMSVPVGFVLGNALEGDVRSGCVGLQVWLEGRARVRIGSYRSFGFGVKTGCEVVVGVPQDGRVGEVVSKKCRRY